MIKSLSWTVVFFLFAVIAQASEILTVSDAFTYRDSDDNVLVAGFVNSPAKQTLVADCENGDGTNEAYLFPGRHASSNKESARQLFVQKRADGGTDHDYCQFLKTELGVLGNGHTPLTVEIDGNKIINFYFQGQ